MMKRIQTDYDFDLNEYKYSTIELTKEKEDQLEKTDITISLRTSTTSGILQITKLEGFGPIFEYQGNDKPRMVRRLELIKNSIDQFIAENQFISENNI